jgi:hypothetical protein
MTGASVFDLTFPVFPQIVWRRERIASTATESMIEKRDLAGLLIQIQIVIFSLDVVSPSRALHH